MWTCCPSEPATSSAYQGTQFGQSRQQLFNQHSVRLSLPREHSAPVTYAELLQEWGSTLQKEACGGETLLKMKLGCLQQLRTVAQLVPALADKRQHLVPAAQGGVAWVLGRATGAVPKGAEAWAAPLLRHQCLPSSPRLQLTVRQAHHPQLEVIRQAGERGLGASLGYHHAGVRWARHPWTGQLLCCCEVAGGTGGRQLPLLARRLSAAPRECDGHPHATHRQRRSSPPITVTKQPDASVIHRTLCPPCMLPPAACWLGRFPLAPPPACWLGRFPITAASACTGRAPCCAGFALRWGLSACACCALGACCACGARCPWCACRSRSPHRRCSSGSMERGTSVLPRMNWAGGQGSGVPGTGEAVWQAARTGSEQHCSCASDACNAAARWPLTIRLRCAASHSGRADSMARMRRAWAASAAAVGLELQQ